MIIIARTPVAGYTPGQIINLEIKVNNQSDQPLTEISVQLIKVNGKFISIEIICESANVK